VDREGTHRQNDGQSRQSRPGGPLGFVELDRLFSQAEAQIDLLRRCQPQNGPAACARWLEAFERGQRGGFAWQHARPPVLDTLKRALDEAQRRLLHAGGLARLYAERAEELLLEAELAECVGDVRFFALARRRYPIGAAEEWTEARRLAETWARETPEPEIGPRQLSHDRASPDSLVSVVTRELARRRMNVRVEVVTSLGSRAATGDGVIFVRTGVLLAAREAQRIALHEILGHALPRVRARMQQLGLFRVGSARGTDDEEGRALCLEQQLDLMDQGRRIELGRRHLAALAVAEGASATECVRLLSGCGATPVEAAATYTRVARGGGLCRELVYLPAWLRLARASALDSELMSWLSHGRVSLAVARSLRDLGITPVTSPLPAATSRK
jgi:hypothetical protein